MAKNTNSKKEPLFHVVKRDDMPAGKAWLIRIAAIVFSFLLVGILSMAIAEKSLGEKIRELRLQKGISEYKMSQLSQRL